MFTIHSIGLAILFCTITMLGWGSWANTQKLAGRTNWPFPLYYWDYAIGVLLFSLVFAHTAGSFGSAGQSARENMHAASYAAAGNAVFSGVLFNVANILLVVAIDSAGMAIAFPVGIGLALIVGTIKTYLQQPQGDPVKLSLGVGLVLFAMVMSALAYRQKPNAETRNRGRGLLFALIAGSLMGLFYPRILAAISPDFNTRPIAAGLLTPYVALFFFAVGLVASNFIVNTIFLRSTGLRYSAYFAGTWKLHLLGVLGGVIWMIAFSLNLLASGVAGAAVSYALGQGATLIAAIWGVFVWKEFRGAPRSSSIYIALMFAGYVSGLVLIGLATVQKT